MKPPKNVRPANVDAAEVAIETLAAAHDPRAVTAMRTAIRADHVRLSQAARELREQAGEPGVLSIEVAGGSRPRMSDATYVPRSEYLDSESEQERGFNATVLQAIDATDYERSFLVLMILGEGFGAFRVNLAAKAPDDARPVLRKPLAGPSILTQVREAAA